MGILLGIDTGGTYTDAVLLDDEGRLIRSAKSLTTKYDLSVGIEKAMTAILPDPVSDIKLVSLSTTLATNAIVEGQGSPICLILIGYDPSAMNAGGLETALGGEAIEFISGGHDVYGDEQAPLDLEEAKKVIMTHASGVSAFAVSGYFGIRNPSHELQVKRLIQELTGLPVTCGHELTAKLNAPLRAVTVALNARIIPLIRQLIHAVLSTMKRKGIRSPLMVVKGDGSLMASTMAMDRPVETILSGPAASVVGAKYQNKVEDCFVIDMGGTTTDIALLSQGKPKLSAKGASVGGWETMVEAIEVHTAGLGGDSEVRLDDGGNIIIGPRRMVPLSLLARQYPAILEVLGHQQNSDEPEKKSSLEDIAGRFILRQRDLGAEQKTLSSTQKEIWDFIGKTPMALTELQKFLEYPSLYNKAIDALMDRGLIVGGAFTPTDALHVLDRYHNGSVEAARLGAGLWAATLGMTIEDFCQRVISQVISQVGQAVISSQLAQEGITLRDNDRVGALFVDRIMNADGGKHFNLAMTLKKPLVAIGAPVECYLPRVADKLNTPVYIPQHAAVGNAIGAAAGSVVQSVRILIRPMAGGKIYRAYMPGEVLDFKRLEDAANHTKETARRLAGERALLAGAKGAKVQVEQHDRYIQGDGKESEEIYFETEVVATAAGRPQIAM